MLVKLLALAILVCSALSKPEYYSILGLPHGSALPQIKKAFKKLASQFHPDVASEDQRDQFSKRFSEISDAYTVLSDAELKNVYDRRGHDGIDELRKQKEWQNQHQAQQEMHNSMVTDHFQGTDLMILNAQALPRFYRRSQVWLVLFYRSQDQEMRSGLKETILDLNSKFYGVFTVAAVNCDQEDSICDEHRAVNTPDIIGFEADVTHDGVRYTGDKTSSRMAGFAVSLMQDFTSVVTHENLEAFLNASPKTKLLLFSDKKEVPPLMKALSKEFRTTLDIGMVKDYTGDVKRRYNIASTPSIIILKNSNAEVVPFNGPIGVQPLSEFIRLHRDLTASQTGKKKAQKLAEVASVDDVFKNGCGAMSKNICVFIVTHSAAEKEKARTESTKVLESLSDSPIVLLLLDAANINLGSLGLGPSTRLIAVKPSKDRLYSQEAPSYHTSDLMNLIDKIIGGSATFSKTPSPFVDAILQDDSTDL